jgi:glutathione S-transferase
MMILRYAPASPFARKVRIAAAVLGLTDDIELQTADPANATDTVRQQNPLGKIPVLIAEDGAAYYDSRVIADYLDQRAGGGRIIPRDGNARFAALRMEALCDGICDASLLHIYEGRYRPADKHVPSWLDYQGDKVTRGFAVLEAAPPRLSATPDIGQIALACTLGYRDLRFAGSWRKDHPRLVAWLDTFAAQVPSFAQTKMPA